LITDINFIIAFVSSPAKKKWRSLVSNYFRTTQRKTIRKMDFPKLLKLLFESSFSIGTMSAGFKRAGVWPYDDQAMKDKVARRSLTADYLQTIK
jgi:hypothetical protein